MVQLSNRISFEKILFHETPDTFDTEWISSNGYVDFFFHQRENFAFEAYSIHQRSISLFTKPLAFFNFMKFRIFGSRPELPIETNRSDSKCLHMKLLQFWQRWKRSESGPISTSGMSNNDSWFHMKCIPFQYNWRMKNIHKNFLKGLVS